MSGPSEAIEADSQLSFGQVTPGGRITGLFPKDTEFIMGFVSMARGPDPIMTGLRSVIRRFPENWRELTAYANNTLLHLMVMHKSPKGVMALVEEGANLEAKNLRGQTPFGMASDMLVLASLGYAKATPEELASLESITAYLSRKMTNEQVQKALLECTWRRITNNSGETLLHLAVKKPSLKQVKEFTGAGANLEALDANGLTPLGRARNTLVLIERKAIKISSKEEGELRQIVDYLRQRMLEAQSNKADAASKEKLVARNGRSTAPVVKQDPVRARLNNPNM